MSMVVRLKTKSKVQIPVPIQTSPSPSFFRFRFLPIFFLSPFRGKLPDLYIYPAQLIVEKAS